ncbi:MAG: hypothetical protein PWP08_448 [Methanofollis sp.]|nr:hypothetical protein [Methanofollis sp.]
MNRILRYALIFLVALVGFSALFLLPMAAGSSGYIIASPCTPRAGDSSVVVHLTTEDFAAHPALSDLVVEGKKVRRPTPLFFLSPSGDDWSPIVLSREEEEVLWWTYMFVRSANGTAVPVFLEYDTNCYRLAPSQS